VLKQADCVASSVSTLCTTYKELAGAAAATKGDGFVECTEPVAEQQQLRLMDAFKALKYSERLRLRKRELAAAHKLVTDAIAAGSGASVLVRGPASSGKWTVVQQLSDDVIEWCKQHGKPTPVSAYLFDAEHPAGLYGAVLDKLKEDKRLQIGHVSQVLAEAKKQLEDVVLNTKRSSSSSSDVPLIVLVVYNTLRVSPVEQLQPLFKWAHTVGSRLILIGRGGADLTQTPPGQQQTGIEPIQVVLDPYTESDMVAIISARAGAAVQLTGLQLCVKHANGNARRACNLCLQAVKLALSDRNKSSVVTVSHMEQAIRLTKLRG
jgi:Cdc6-like AAA superfamily ATPase